MILRQANKSDAESIAQVQVDTWHTTYTGLVPQDMLDQISISQGTDIWAEIISEAKTTTFVVENSSRVVGFVNVGPTRDEDKDPSKTGEILAIYIDQIHQGTGKGRELFIKALDYFKERGFTEFSLWVLDTNSKTRQFYERMGMHADGFTKTEGKGSAILSEVRYIAKL